MIENEIKFKADDGSEISMYCIEETTIGSTRYLLVSDSDEADEEATAYILKDVSSENDEEAVYEMVDDEEEFDAVADLFGAILDEYADLIG